MDVVKSAKSDFIMENVQKNQKALKFQLPNTTAGSIIYFKYRVEDFAYYTKNAAPPFFWTLINEYPILHARCEISTPKRVM
jgi:hypothetical protein